MLSTQIVFMSFMEAVWEQNSSGLGSSVTVLRSPVQ